MENIEESQLNSDKIWKVWKKGKLKSVKIWKIWKKSKLNIIIIIIYSIYIEHYLIKKLVKWFTI